VAQKKLTRIHQEELQLKMERSCGARKRPSGGSLEMFYVAKNAVQQTRHVIKRGI
jgi:hypothetical protein